MPATTRNIRLVIAGSYRQFKSWTSDNPLEDADGIQVYCYETWSVLPYHNVAIVVVGTGRETPAYERALALGMKDDWLP